MDLVCTCTCKQAYDTKKNDEAEVDTEEDAVIMVADDEPSQIRMSVVGEAQVKLRRLMNMSNGETLEVINVEVTGEGASDGADVAPVVAVAEPAAPKKRGRPKSTEPKPAKEPKPPREKKDPATRHSKAVAGALTPSEYERVHAVVMADASVGTVSQLVRTAVLSYVAAFEAANPALPGTETQAA